MIVLNIPGYQNSGENHWQTHWENEFSFLTRVEMPDWENPQKSEWVKTLNAAVLGADERVFLVAHSLGCTTISHLSEVAKKKVCGAFLVSNPDLEHNDTLPDCLYTFTPIPRTRLPFPTLMVASGNDPYCPETAAVSFAKDWGSELVIIGHKGHISGADVNDWQDGKSMFLEFLQSIEGREACGR